MNVTYILECRDQTLYTGWTNDIKKRLEAHNQGRGAKYTRGRTPVKLVYLEAFHTKQEAMKREIAIKKLSRADKLRLIDACDVEAVFHLCMGKAVQRPLKGVLKGPFRGRSRGAPAEPVSESGRASAPRKT